MKEVLPRIERERYIYHRIIPPVAYLICIVSLLLALSFAFNLNGFRDSFQHWYVIAGFFLLILLAPFAPGIGYEWYEDNRDESEENETKEIREYKNPKEHRDNLL